mmetsp:Transcript_47748/g.91299  ORF Transcript_47748/g.91299 Transcript_47748/m.91299 type:complete len:202 (-) Transcript_47748:2126-2731(-)
MRLHDVLEGAQVLLKTFALDVHDFRLGSGDDVGGTRLVEEKGALPKLVARLESQHFLEPRLWVSLGHHRLSLTQNIKLVPLFALAQDVLALLEGLLAELLHQNLQVAHLESRQLRASPQQSQVCRLGGHLAQITRDQLQCLARQVHALHSARRHHQRGSRFIACMGIAHSLVHKVVVRGQRSQHLPAVDVLDSHFAALDYQ